MAQRFAIVLTVGGRTKSIIASAKKVAYSKGKVFGLTEYLLWKNPKKHCPACKVWIYSRQSLREKADCFFHEMTHVFFDLMGGIKKQGAREEMVCRWIGYLAKVQLTDFDPKKYARKPAVRLSFG